MNKSQLEAKKILESCGLDEITNFDMSLFVSGLDAIYIEEPLSNCDGKIIFGKSKVIIKVNSQIQFLERKRFVAAHEIGHLFLHKNLELPEDTFSNFNIISGMEKALKNGVQELQANEFASELLMPQDLFLLETKNKKFSPLLIKQLSHRFKASLTAVVFRCMELNVHPLCLIFIENGFVKYWKKSAGLNVWLNDYIRLAPPLDSVASEYIHGGYNFIYALDEKAQTISKSTWFKLSVYGDADNEFFEYCIPTKKHKTILSIIWED